MTSCILIAYCRRSVLNYFVSSVGGGKSTVPFTVSLLPSSFADDENFAAPQITSYNET
jgi:hypothetical protein